MAVEDTGSNVMVSVQDAGAPDAVQGHLAWGRLIRNDYVIVRGPPLWWDPDMNLEVLVAALRPAGVVRLQRLKVSGLRLGGIPNRPELQLTGVRTAHPAAFSTFSLPSRERGANPDSTEETVRAVLGGLGNPASADGLTNAVDPLASVAEYERQLRHSLLEVWTQAPEENAVLASDTAGQRTAASRGGRPKSFFRWLLGF